MAQAQAAKKWGELTFAEQQDIYDRIMQRLVESEMKDVLLNASTQTEIKKKTREQEAVLTIQGDVPFSQADKVKALKEFINSLVSDLSDGLGCVLPVGETIPNLPVINLETKTEEPLLGGARQGLITLITFWSAQQETMATLDILDQLAQKHKKSGDWKNKAAMIFCALDGKQAEVEEAVANNEWTCPQIWVGQKGWDSELCTAIGISKAPTTLLLDASGKILKRGHPTSFGKPDHDMLMAMMGAPIPAQAEESDNEDDEDEDDEEEEDDEEDESANLKKWSELTEPERHALLADVETFMNNSNLELVSVNTISDRTWTAKRGYKSANLIVVSGACPDKHAEQLNNLYRVLATKISNCTSTVTELTLNPCTPPRILPACSECKKNFGENDTKYVCVACSLLAPPYNLCEACEAKRDTLLHLKHHVFALVQPQAANFDQMVTGPGNVVTYPPEQDDEEKPSHNCFCNACGSSITMTRFKCCHCLDFDLCEACILLWRESANGIFEPCHHDHAADEKQPEHEHHCISGPCTHDKTHVFLKLHTPAGYQLTAVEEDEDGDDDDDEDDEDFPEEDEDGDDAEEDGEDEDDEDDDEEEEDD